MRPPWVFAGNGEKNRFFPGGMYGGKSTFLGAKCGLWRLAKVHTRTQHPPSSERLGVQAGFPSSKTAPLF